MTELPDAARPPARVLIAGCGQVGTRVGLAWAARGATVVGVRRAASRIPAPIVAVGADLSDPVAVERVVADHGPFDLAYLIVTPDRYDDVGYRDAYVAGAWTLCEVLGRADAGGRPPRLVFVSSTAVYGQSAGEWVDESSPTHPTGFSGQRVLEAEGVVAAATAGGRIEGTSVRYGGIYGPGRDHSVRRVRAGDACHDDPPRYTNRIHEDDVVGSLVHVGGLARVEPVYVGVDDEPATDCAVMDFIADRLGVSRPPRRASGDAAQVGVRGGNKRCRNAGLHAAGYRFVHPTYREGYAALIG